MKIFETLNVGFGKGLIVTRIDKGSFVGQDIQKTRKVISSDLDQARRRKKQSRHIGTFPHLFPLEYLTKRIRVDGYNNGEAFVPIFDLAFCQGNSIVLSLTVKLLTEKVTSVIG